MVSFNTYYQTFSSVHFHKQWAVTVTQRNLRSCQMDLWYKIDNVHVVAQNSCQKYRQSIENSFGTYMELSFG